MTSRFPLADNRSRLWLGLTLMAAMLAVLIAHFATVQAQAPDQLTVYSPQTSYSVPLFDEKGQPYAGLVELLEPLGSIDAKPDGKKYKLRFTPPGGRPAEAQFNDGKDKGKVRGENYKLPANFVLQNGRGYVPLSTVPELLTKLLATPVQLHPSARRLFIGDVPMRFTLELDKGNPPRLVVSFPSPVNPSIATEPGRVRFTFRREPVISSGQDSFNFNDPVITGAVFSEHDGLAELDVMGTVPLMANFADGGRTHYRGCGSSSASSAAARSRATGASTAAGHCTPAQATGSSTLPGIDRSCSWRGGHRSGHYFVAGRERCSAGAGAAGATRTGESWHRRRNVAQFRCRDFTGPTRCIGECGASGAVYHLARRQYRARRTCVHRDAAGGQPVEAGILALGHGAGGIP